MKEVVEEENSAQDKPTQTKSSKLRKFGVLFSNLSIVCLVFCVLALFTVILLPIIWLLGFMLIIVTVGFIFAIFPDYWSKLEGLTNTMNTLGEILLKIGPYVAGAGIAMSILAIVLLALDKNKKNTGKIVSTVIVCVLLVVSLIMCFIK